MAWVLLVWWYSRALSWWERSIAFFFLFFTVLATLGTGEHYLIDLVVAFPFAVFVEALVRFRPAALEPPARLRNRIWIIHYTGVVCRFALRHTFLLADNSSTLGALHPDGCIVGGC
jgi:hypothetical protein